MNIFKKSRIAPTSIIELSLAARNLPMLDHLSKADGRCVVEIKRPGADTWEVLDKTETIGDDSNPDFSTKINIPYRCYDRVFSRVKSATLWSLEGVMTLEGISLKKVKIYIL